MIGYFDLDPNRALDIILDVFSVNIATHWHFFLALLTCSPWVGEHTRLRDWSASGGMDLEPERYRGKSLDEILRAAEGDAYQPEAPSKPTEQTNPKVLAQILGFKFSHYQVRPQYYRLRCPVLIILSLRSSRRTRRRHVPEAFTWSQHY